MSPFAPTLFNEHQSTRSTTRLKLHYALLQPCLFFVAERTWNRQAEQVQLIGYTLIELQFALRTSRIKSLTPSALFRNLAKSLEFWTFPPNRRDVVITTSMFEMFLLMGDFCVRQSKGKCLRIVWTRSSGNNDWRGGVAAVLVKNA